MKAFKIFVTAAVASLWACEKEIDLALPAEDALLTLDARLSAGDSIVVLAGVSASVLNNAGPILDNHSQVYLYEDDVLRDTLIARLNPQAVHPTGEVVFTYHSTLIPQPEHSYRLRIERDGYSAAYATDQVPSGILIEDWHLDTAQKKLSFSFVDHAGTTDYYMVEIVETRPDQITRHQFTTFDPTIQMLYASGDAGTSGSVGRKALLTDEFFNAEKKHLQLHYGDELSQGNQYELRFSHISQHYYQYELSKAVEEPSGLQLFHNKANLHNNLSQGYGVVICTNPRKQFFIP